MELMHLRREVLAPRRALAEPCDRNDQVKRMKRSFVLLLFVGGLLPAAAQFLERLL